MYFIKWVLSTRLTFKTRKNTPHIQLQDSLPRKLWFFKLLLILEKVIVLDFILLYLGFNWPSVNCICIYIYIYIVGVSRWLRNVLNYKNCMKIIFFRKLYVDITTIDNLLLCLGMAKYAHCSFKVRQLLVAGWINIFH